LALEDYPVEPADFVIGKMIENAAVQQVPRQVNQCSCHELILGKFLQLCYHNVICMLCYCSGDRMCNTCGYGSGLRRFYQRSLSSHPAGQFGVAVAEEAQ